MPPPGSARPCASTVSGPKRAQTRSSLSRFALLGLRQPELRREARRAATCRCCRCEPAGEIRRRVAQPDHELAVELAGVTPEAVGVDDLRAVRGGERVQRVRQLGVSPFAPGTPSSRSSRAPPEPTRPVSALSQSFTGTPQLMYEPLSRISRRARRRRRSAAHSAKFGRGARAATRGRTYPPPSIPGRRRPS